jgi:hypothetical protein
VVLLINVLVALTLLAVGSSRRWIAASPQAAWHRAPTASANATAYALRHEERRRAQCGRSSNGPFFAMKHSRERVFGSTFLVHRSRFRPGRQIVGGHRGGCGRTAARRAHWGCRDDNQQDLFVRRLEAGPNRSSRDPRRRACAVRGRRSKRPSGRTRLGRRCDARPRQMDGMPLAARSNDLSALGCGGSRR